VKGQGKTENQIRERRQKKQRRKSANPKGVINAGKNDPKLLEPEDKKENNLDRFHLRAHCTLISGNVPPSFKGVSDTNGSVKN